MSCSFAEISFLRLFNRSISYHLEIQIKRQVYFWWAFLDYSGCNNWILQIGILSIYFSQFWRQGVWGQGVGMVWFWWEPSFWSTDTSLLTVFSRSRERERKREISPVSSHKITYTIMRAPPSWSDYPPKDPSPLSSHWGLGFQHIGGRRETTIQTKREKLWKIWF